MGIKENLLNTMAETHPMSALLERGCEFEGKLTFEGSVRINGSFSGEIFSNDVLIIGDTAVVNAEIDVDTLIVSGEVNGGLTARTRMEVRRPAVVRGNLCTPCLIIEEGVIFEGSCRMPAAVAKKSEEVSEIRPVAEGMKRQSA